MKPDLSGRTCSRRQSRRTADLRLIATNSQIWASSAWTNPAGGRMMWLVGCGMRMVGSGERLDLYTCAIADWMARWQRFEIAVPGGEVVPHGE